MISIITPWLNAPTLIPTYERSVDSAHEVIIIDNGSEPENAEQIRAMVERLGGRLIRNDTNRGFAPANNQGLEVAHGDVVLFLNNDIEAPEGWLKQVERDVRPNALYGPSKGNRHGVEYLEGYCLAARREVWDALGGWPADLPGMYWEDNILCLRAVRGGFRLVETRWPVWHFSNFTSRSTAGAYDHSAANERVFVGMLQ